MERNIKLVVSDVDSTLLMPHEEHVDRRFFETVKKLKNKGISLAIASGRTYEELKSIFAEAIEDIYFITLSVRTSHLRGDQRDARLKRASCSFAVARI